MLDRTTPELQLEQSDADVSRVTCPQCGNGFLPRDGTGGKPQRYCGDKCKEDARKARRSQRSQRDATGAPASPTLVSQNKNPLSDIGQQEGDSAAIPESLKAIANNEPTGSFFACLISAEITVWVSLPATLANIT